MKNVLFLLVILLLSINSYSLFTDLNGSFDENGNPILFYRSHGIYYDSSEDLTYENTKSVYKYDLNNSTNSLFLLSGSTDMMEGPNLINLDISIKDFQYIEGNYFYIKHFSYMNGGTGESWGYRRFYSNYAEYSDNSYDLNSPYYILALSPSNTQTIYLSDSHNGYFLKSIDGGENWIELHLEHDRNYNLWGVSTSNENILFASSEEDLYKSIDGGISFYLVNSESNLGWLLKKFPLNIEYYQFGNPLKLHFGTGQNIYAVTRKNNENHLAVSNDAGENWFSAYTTENPLYISADSSDPNVIYMTVDNVIFKSIDNGASFIDISQISEDIAGIYKKPNSDNLYAISYSEGLFELTPNGIYTLLEPIVSSENIISPNVTNISNHPNPFNPVTTITFTIPKMSTINLSIFNIKGQKIKDLANCEFNAGSHSIVWYGNNDLGNSISSGVYFYRLDVNGKIETVNKCLLLK